MPFVLLDAWTAESDQAAAHFGEWVAAAGDVNADGYDDVAVGAWGFGSGQVDEGRAFVYHGGPAGLTPFAVWTADGNQTQAYFGETVSSAGDVDGDGYGDVVVGAYTIGGEGAAMLYSGSPLGLGLLPSWTGAPEGGASGYGSCVSSAGDVNADGYGDVVVADHSFSNEGKVYVYHGSLSGLGATADWIETGLDGSFFGYSVASAGDVNGDGYGDLVVGAEKSDQAFVYYGSAAGLSATADWSVESDVFPAYFGRSVSSAGDVNGDGYDDVIVGAPLHTGLFEQEGRALLYLGSAAGLEATAAWIVDAGQDQAYYGSSVASAGDVNADGYDDVLVGAHAYDIAATNEGRAYLFLGSAAGLSTTPAWTGEIGDESAYYGISVSSAGDVDGDGFDDVVIGASYADHGQQNEGRAYVYHGTCDDPIDSDLDTIGDACDLCAGFDDLVDLDLDGVPDDCDSCIDVIGSGGDDADADGVCAEMDCNDADPMSFPGAPELCDGMDNDCDGDVPADESDADGDGIRVCADDCDDASPTMFPGAEELCNRLDDNCDGSLAAEEIDGDGDNWSACAGDCDDTDPELRPGLVDVCGDGVDNNCDGAADEDCDTAAGTGGCGCGATGGLGALPLGLAAMWLVSSNRKRHGTVRWGAGKAVRVDSA